MVFHRNVLGWRMIGKLFSRQNLILVCPNRIYKVFENLSADKVFMATVCIGLLAKEIIHGYEMFLFVFFFPKFLLDHEDFCLG